MNNISCECTEVNPADTTTVSLNDHDLGNLIATCLLVLNGWTEKVAGKEERQVFNSCENALKALAASDNPLAQIHAAVYGEELAELKKRLIAVH